MIARRYSWRMALLAILAVGTGLLAVPAPPLVSNVAYGQDARPCPASSVEFGATRLQIESPLRRHDFSVELADSPEQRARGLMCRTEVAADGGMLFDYGWPQRIAMWMRNTLVPLDMLFVDETGRIFVVVRNATPLSETVIDPGGPVRAVIELRGGTVDRLDIRRGDKVNHPIFGRPLQ